MCRSRSRDRGLPGIVDETGRGRNPEDDRHSDSSRDTLSSLYSNPMEVLYKKEMEKWKNVSNETGNGHESYATPPPSSSSSLIIQNEEANQNQPSNFEKRYETRKRDGIININTINLLEKELYNLSPKSPPITATIPPLVSNSPPRLFSNKVWM